MIKFPANCVDFDNYTICTLSSLIEENDLDALNLVISSGCADGIHWGKTAPNEHGITTVLVDVNKIEKRHINSLWIEGIIGGGWR